MKDQNKAYLYALLAVLFWSTAASAFKITLRYIDPIGLLFFSSFTSLIVFIIFYFFNERSRISKKDIFHSAILGFLNPFAYYVILFKAYSLLPAQLAQPLNFIWPLMIVLLSIPILKQKISMKSIVSILISFTGVIIISTEGKFQSSASSWGIFLALFSSIIWAIFFIYNVKDKRGEISKLLLSFIFGFIYISIFYLPRFAMPAWQGIVGSLYIGFFEMGVTFVFWIRALKLSKTTAGVNDIIYLTPFISLIFINLFVGEKILFSTVIGLILIITGIILQKKRNIKNSYLWK